MKILVIGGGGREHALVWRLKQSPLVSEAVPPELTISLPRLRPCAGEFQPPARINDRELVQLVCAFRLMFPARAEEWARGCPL